MSGFFDNLTLAQNTTTVGTVTSDGSFGPFTSRSLTMVTHPSGPVASIGSGKFNLKNNIILTNSICSFTIEYSVASGSFVDMSNIGEVDINNVVFSYPRNVIQLTLTSDTTTESQTAIGKSPTFSFGIGSFGSTGMDLTKITSLTFVISLETSDFPIFPPTFKTGTFTSVINPSA